MKPVNSNPVGPAAMKCVFFLCSKEIMAENPTAANPATAPGPGKKIILNIDQLV